MIDFHLSELYNVETKALNQAVKRNLKRFPLDFMFQLTEKEWRALKMAMSNTLTNNEVDDMWSQIVTTSKRRLAHLPYAFTEQGVAMLSSVLRSDRAIDLNIVIMRAFVILRQHLTNYSELSQRITSLEKQTNRKFKDIHDAIHHLMSTENAPEIGFKQSNRNP